MPYSETRPFELEVAGVEGFEPPDGGIKTRCLTTWRHPNRARTAGPLRPHLADRSTSGERLRPRQAKPRQAEGTFAQISAARACDSTATNTQAPVPVIRARPNWPSQSSA